MKRRTTFILCAADLAIWALIAVYVLISRSDPATRGLDLAALGAVTALLLLTALPAFLLTRADRYPGGALALALAFPGAFILGFALIVATLP
jgi:Kef-type K+ transport system membrane component KefB